MEEVSGFSNGTPSSEFESAFLIFDLQVFGIGEVEAKFTQIG